MKNGMIKQYFFFLALANAIIIFQFVNIAAIKGIDTDVALQVYSLMQLNIIASIFLKNFLAKKYDFKNIAIIVLFMRIILLSLIMLSSNVNVFLVSMFLYGFVFSGFDVVNEAIVSTKCSVENHEYGVIRKFYSIGFAVNGVAVILMMMILPYSFIIPLLILLNVICLGLVIKNDFFKVSNKIVKEVEEKVTGFNFRLLFLVFIIMLIVVTPNLFAVNLNTFIVEAYDVTYEYATFVSTICVVFGCLISEVYGMQNASRYITKYGAINIIRFAGVITLIRWIITILATSPFILILSYLLHGVAFAFAYLGAMSYIEQNLGHKYVGSFVSLNTIFSSVFIAVSLALLSSFIITYSTSVVVVFNIFIAVVSIILFEVYLLYNYKYKTLKEKNI